MRNSGQKSLGVGLLLTLACSSAYGLTYYSTYTPNTESRFYVGADRAFIGQSYDLSGVSVDFDELDGRSLNGPCATMISPSYFVTAKHYAVTPGTPLVFVDPSGNKHVYYAAASQYQAQVGGVDIFIGRLTEPLRPQDNIAYYPIPLYTATADYLGNTILDYAQKDQVCTGTVTAVTLTNGSQPAYIEWSGTAYVVSGDSSHPTFVTQNNQFALLGATQGARIAGRRDGGFPALSGYISQVNAVMGTEFVRTIDLNGTLSAAPTPAPALSFPTVPMTSPSLLAISTSGTLYRYNPQTLVKTAQIQLPYTANMKATLAVVGGNIFTADSFNGAGYGTRILRYQADGTPFPASGHTGATFATPGDLAGMNDPNSGTITRLVPGADGFLYAVANSGIWRFDPTTAATSKLIATTATALCIGPDANADGLKDFYVSHANSVDIYDAANGTLIKNLLPAGSVNDIRDLIITQNRLIMTCGYNSGGDDKLHIFDATTGAAIDVGYGAGLLNSYKFNHADGLTLASDGSVYASDTYNSKIWKVDVLTGALTSVISGYSPMAVMSFDSVPEPMTTALLGLGLSVTLLARRRPR